MGDRNHVERDTFERVYLQLVAVKERVSNSAKPEHRLARLNQTKLGVTK